MGGGTNNTASGLASVVNGGKGNTASTEYTVVGGGIQNTASGARATVGGGYYNTASGARATVPGGEYNNATGHYSFAAGRKAKANHRGSFVWADSENANFESTATDQFAISASNGVWVAKDAGQNKDVPYGTRYGDNTIVAWAKVYHTGYITDGFNILSTTNVAEGHYEITLRTTATSNTELIPVANVETDSQPTSLNDVRFISIDQYGTDHFYVYINNGSGAPTNHEFTIIVTGR